MEQSAKKDGQILILEDELVKCFKFLFFKHSLLSIHHIGCSHFCMLLCYQDMRLKSIESMKGKTEITVEELTAKLSRKAEEIQIFKVIQMQILDCYLTG